MRSMMKITVITALSVLLLVALSTASASDAAAAPPRENGGGEAVGGVVGEIKVEREACYLLCVNGELCLCNVSGADERVNCCVGYCDGKCGGDGNCGDVPKKPCP